MADAYRYASGGPISREIQLLGYLDHFGAQAILGRPLGAGEVRRLVTAENIVKAYQGRAAAENWATWANENPVLSALLFEVEKGVMEDGE